MKGCIFSFTVVDYVILHAWYIQLYFVFLFTHCMRFLALHYLPLDASFVQTFTESHMFNLLLPICLIYLLFTSFSANRGYLRCPISLQI